MTKPLRRISCSIALILFFGHGLAHAADSPQWLTYPGGEGPGKGRRIVLIAADQEYRSEQSMPMMAKILSKHHGFDCTVLFGVNDKGEVDPTMPVYPEKEDREEMGSAAFPSVSPIPIFHHTMPMDLRSDTITQPTPAMREAMARAEVGDDVFGDDPTVAGLEARVAEILGKEAAVFTPSGTMANQLALRAHTEPGDEILLDGNAHIYYYETGAPAALAGVMCRCLPGARGVFTAADVEAALRPADQHYSPTKLVCVENTHNRGGGSVWPLERIREIADVSRRNGLRLHLDGARLWNAAVATGIPERDYAAHFDSVSVCFSKGLGAPIGSALCGSREFIQRARRFRKMYGGGMRQAGIIAAGALHALEHHRQRLAEDHASARALAEGLSNLPGLELDPASVQTNIVLMRVRKTPAASLVRALDGAGLRVLAVGPENIRAVTNLMVTFEDISVALKIFESVLGRVLG